MVVGEKHRQLSFYSAETSRELEDYKKILSCWKQPLRGFSCRNFRPRNSVNSCASKSTRKRSPRFPEQCLDGCGGTRHRKCSPVNSRGYSWNRASVFFLHERNRKARNLAKYTNEKPIFKSTFHKIWYLQLLDAVLTIARNFHLRTMEDYSSEYFRGNQTIEFPIIFLYRISCDICCNESAWNIPLIIRREQNKNSIPFSQIFSSWMNSPEEKGKINISSSEKARRRREFLAWKKTESIGWRSKQKVAPELARTARILTSITTHDVY